MAWSGFDDEWLQKQRAKGAKLVNWEGEPAAVVRVEPEAEKRVVKSAVSAGLPVLVGLCRGMGLPQPVVEWYFAKPRMWRFDYAWPEFRLALEVEGGIWTQGRHTRGAGALKDLEKYSEAAILGWRIIYCVPDDLATVGLDRVQRALNRR